MRTGWLVLCLALSLGCRDKTGASSEVAEVDTADELTLVFTLDSDAVDAGTSLPFSLVWAESDGDTVPVESFSVDSAMEDPLLVDDFTLTATTAGAHTLTATAMQPNGSQQMATASLLVHPGPATELSVHLSADEVEAGGTITYTLNAVDGHGNDVLTADAEIESDEAVVVEEDSLTTTLSGDYTLTATLDEIQGAAEWSVVPGPATTIDLVLDDTDLESGDSTTFTVAVTDAHGNAADDPTSVGVDEEGATVTEDTIEFQTDGTFHCWAEVTGTEIIDVETIVIDSTGPDLIVYTPERGSWTSDLEVEVTGHAEDEASGLDFVTINDEEAKGIVDGDFAETVYLDFGMNIIQTVASDLDWDDDEVGNQSSDVRAVLHADTFSDPSTPIDDGLHLRMWEGEGGLGQLESLATSLMDSIDLESVLSAGAIYEDRFCILFFICFEFSVYVDAITYESVSMSIDTQEDGSISARLTLSDVYASLRTEGDVEGEGIVTATDVHVDMSFVPVVTDSGYLDVTDFTVDVPTPDGFAIELDDTLTDAADLLGLDVEAILDEELGGALEDAVLDAVPDMLGELLSILAFDEEFSVSSGTYILSSRIQAIEVDEYGATFRARTSVASSEEIVAGTDGEPSGFPYFGYSHPSWATTGSGTLFSLSTDMLNQLLFAFWQGGMFDQELTEEDLGLDMSTIALLLPELESITMITTPLLPLVAIPRSDWAEGDQYDLQLGDTLIQIYNGEVSEETLAFELYISAIAPLTLVTEDGDWSIALELSDPTVWADEVYTDPSLGISPAVTEALFMSLMTAYLPELTGALGTIPLPSFEGLSFTDISTGLEGPEEPPGYWVLSGSLE